MKSFNEKGFTLIELLIVIGIIAILAAAVIVAINPGQQFAQARNASRQSHLSSISTAIYSHYVTEGGWPDCLPNDYGDNDHADWVNLHDDGEDGCEGDLEAYLSGGTMPETVADGDIYEARLRAGGGQIELRIAQEDGEGTTIHDEWEDDMNIIQ